MNKFEYKTISLLKILDTDGMVDDAKLNAMGDSGWELTDILKGSAVFKREKETPPVQKKDDSYWVVSSSYYGNYSQHVYTEEEGKKLFEQWCDFVHDYDSEDISDPDFSETITLWKGKGKDLDEQKSVLEKTITFKD